MNILLFTNILTPYRIQFYDQINDYCARHKHCFRVLVMTRSEENRNWNYEQFERSYTMLLDGKRIKIGNYRINISYKLKEQVTRFHPDIVVAAGSYIHPSLWMLIKICKTIHIPILFWSESHLNTERNYSKAKMLIRETLRSVLYKSFDGFCYAGKLSKQFIEKYAHDDAKYIFLPNLIDNDFYGTEFLNVNPELENKYREILEGDKRKYIIPARLSPDKGLVEFLTLYKSIDRKKTRILIAGDGELEPVLMEIIRKDNIDVGLLGFVQKEEMRYLYRHVDGFILPSKVDPNPLTCVEALWSGLPMLVSDHVGNYPEVIDPGMNGFVFSYEQNDATNIIAKYLYADTRLDIFSRRWYCGR